MRDRLKLSEKLHTICSNIYFQPDSNTKLKYPCILYDFNSPLDFKADNGNNITYARYTVTNIYKTIKDRKFDELREKFFYISFDRQYKADGLYHDVYTLYY